MASSGSHIRGGYVRRLTCRRAVRTGYARRFGVHTRGEYHALHTEGRMGGVKGEERGSERAMEEGRKRESDRGR
eukprot:3553202-Rhodomonas_salina.1